MEASFTFWLMIGAQQPALLAYPDLTHVEIHEALDRYYRQ